MKESRMKLVSQVKTFSVVFFKAIDSWSLLPASSLGWYYLILWPSPQAPPTFSIIQLKISVTC